MIITWFFLTKCPIFHLPAFDRKILSFSLCFTTIRAMIIFSCTHIFFLVQPFVRRSTFALDYNVDPGPTTKRDSSCFDQTCCWISSHFFLVLWLYCNVDWHSALAQLIGGICSFHRERFGRWYASQCYWRKAGQSPLRALFFVCGPVRCSPVPQPYSEIASLNVKSTTSSDSTTCNYHDSKKFGSVAFGSAQWSGSKLT